MPWARLPQTPVQTHRNSIHVAPQVQTPVQTFRSALPSPKKIPAAPSLSGTCLVRQGSVGASLEVLGASSKSAAACVGREPSSPIKRVREGEPGHEVPSPSATMRSPSATMREVGNDVSSPKVITHEGCDASSPKSCMHEGNADCDAGQKSMDGETIKKLHMEIGSLRSELEALRGFLDDGGGSSVGQALRSIWGSTSIDVRIDEEEEAVSPRSPREGRRVSRSPGSSAELRPASPVTLSMSTPPRPQSPQLPRRASKQALLEKQSLKATEKTSPREGHVGGKSPATAQSESPSQAQRSSSVSRLPQQDLTRPRGFSGLEQTDCIDDMWCTALRCFPDHPHWTLLKVSSGVYRLGSRTGKKILCQISHGGLQVRVGGGWMSANSFLQKYGPQCMGSGTADSSLDSSTETPVNMERLLVPTKSWAKKIGINTSPDLREMRRPGEQVLKECQASLR